jgi:hypothetical protein
MDFPVESGPPPHSLDIPRILKSILKIY